jgi:hypothetical protein
MSTTDKPVPTGLPPPKRDTSAWKAIVLKYQQPTQGRAVWQWVNNPHTLGSPLVSDASEPLTLIRALLRHSAAPSAQGHATSSDGARGVFPAPSD